MVAIHAYGKRLTVKAQWFILLDVSINHDIETVFYPVLLYERAIYSLIKNNEKKQQKYRSPERRLEIHVLNTLAKTKETERDTYI